MRVLIVGLNYAPEATGIAPYTTGLAQGLVGRGHEVRVLTTFPHYPQWKIQEGYRGWSTSESIEGVTVNRLRHYVPAAPKGLARLLSEVTFGVRLLLTRWGKPDVVLFVSPALFSTAIGVLKSKLVRKIPSVVWVQDIYSLGVVEAGGETSGGAVARVMTAVESAVMKGASSVVAIHDRFSEALAVLGASRENLDVVRNWTHLKEIPETDRDAMRHRLGWGDDEIIALHAGNQGLKQDLGNVVSAGRVADSTSSKVRFVLLGSGSQRAALESQAEGVLSIEFLDSLPGDDFQHALRAADVLIVNEAGGLRDMAVPSKLTSYFASGRPVVAATDASSVTASEIVASRAGVRVDPSTPAALLAAVEHVGGDHALAAELGMEGKRYQKDVLSEAAAILKFEAALQNVGNGAPRRAQQLAHHQVA